MKNTLAMIVLAGAPAVGTAPVDDGWHEAVVSVDKLDERIAFFRDVIGWELVERADVSRDQLAAWRLPGHASGQTALVRAPGSRRGAIRLVAFGGLPAAGRIRSSAGSWETGGWAGLNVRVRSIDAVFNRLQRAGWQGLSDPVTFKVPPYVVREVMVVGPDGLTLSLIERLDPPITPDWTGLWSRAITVFEADAEPALSRRFYADVLGLKPWLTYDGPAAEPGMNLFGLPHDLLRSVTRQVIWWQERGRGDGTIASLAFRGAAGRRFEPPTLAPPRLGLFLITMRVSDAASRCARAAKAGVPFVQPTRRIDRAGTGPTLSCIVATPSGSWLELYQAG
jgi:catechol 2,3-dioxygenase-like lactoylglutathione lyase family enzyme